MNAILGMTDLALQHAVSDKAREYLSIVKCSGGSLLRIINEILDFSKIESGKLVIEQVEFSLHDILLNLVDMFKQSSCEKGLSLKIDAMNNVPDGLIGDPLRLKQILVNLVSNAIKFTHDGEVAVKISSQEKSPDAVLLLFAIRDTGVGISEGHLRTIFNSFEQADGSTTREFGGTGLGLAISKKLIELMGGEIWVESHPGQGSVFFFSVPFKASVGQAVKGAIPEPKGAKILVVDDDLYLLGYLKEILERNGFVVDICPLPSDGIALLRDRAQQGRAFDLVIIDLLFPDQDGISATKTIRNDPLIAKVPILMLTGFGGDLQEDRANQAGANAFLHKPVKSTLLLEAIEDILHTAGPPPKVDAGLGAEGNDKALQGRRILLVEDVLFNQILAQELLNGAGAFVAVASNGKEALEMIDLGFDAVLMDVQMPVMNGYEATRIIRQNPKYADLPIIAMTAHAMSSDREKCFDAGMNDYLSKPFEFEDVFRILASHLKRVKIKK